MGSMIASNVVAQLTLLKSAYKWFKAVCHLMELSMHGMILSLKRVN